MTKTTPINSDAPLFSPSEDSLGGYASFAGRLADVSCSLPATRGCVVSVQGVWGSGKTTLLNFVKYHLKERAEINRPLVIEFNPWWFRDHDDLAGQLLSAFRAKYIVESEGLRRVGDLLAKYGDQLGSVVSNGFGIPWIDKPIVYLLKKLARSPKSIPAAKREIEDALAKIDRRTVVIIDDIDRLAPTEMCELFKVIRALADFPNVTYFLAFDRNVVSSALQTALQVDGDAYLEKMIQVPFTLPKVEKRYLRKMFFSGLDRMLEGAPSVGFNQNRWGNLFYRGIDDLFVTPRDVNRILNALNALYPVVAGEVNTIDFVALEVLRVQVPEVYELIRDEISMFAAVKGDTTNEQRKVVRDFHETWLEKLRNPHKRAVKELILELFPQLQGILGNMNYASGFYDDWHNERRICSKDLAKIYFGFGVAIDGLSRAESLRLLDVAGISDTEARKLLLASADVKREDGSSKATEYLDMLNSPPRDVSATEARNLLFALADAGDDLLTFTDENSGGFFSLPNRWRLGFAVQRLLEFVPEGDRPNFLEKLARDGKAIGLLVYLISMIEEYEQKAEGKERPLATLNASVLPKLKTVMTSRFSRISETDLIKLDDLPMILSRWRAWGDERAAIAMFSELVKAPENRAKLLERFLLRGKGMGIGDAVATTTYHLDPKSIAPYLDLDEMAKLVDALEGEVKLSETQAIAVSEFKKGMERLRAGKDTSAFATSE